ncbi:MAG: TIGR00296 family protein [Candidatus Hodarchaeota archaeon]
MTTLLTLQEGTILTKFARKSIEDSIRKHKVPKIPASDSKVLSENRGVFVTLKTQHPRDLRGCIGFLQPSPNSKQSPLPLLQATQQAALSSAFKDPRFPPVQETELDTILVEVSVLTIPEELDVENRLELPNHIVVGKHGLIIEGKGWHRGLLLPQVAPEQGWNAEEFLKGCCQKAGLGVSCYMDPDVRVFTFQAQIFAEEHVRGKIVERTF